MLHAGEAESESKEKIEPFTNKAFYPFQDVSIDEIVVKW